MTEHASQCSVIAWAHYMVAQYPELELLYAVPNGSMYGADNEVGFAAKHNIPVYFNLADLISNQR